MSNSQFIFRNLAEVIGREELEAKLASKGKLIGYIGFAPTGQVHLGYLIPCMKIRDLTLAGCDVAIMLADLHAILDDRKTPTHLVEARSDYYRLMLTKILTVLGADLSHVKFVRGSEFQKTGDYFMDVLELSSRIPVSATKRAGTEVLKQNKDIKHSATVYPIMQAIDENYVGQATFGLQVDFELGGLDQRKIFCFSRDCDNCKIGYLMNPIVSLSKTGKMSASDSNGKISFTDDEATIATKISKAFCCDGNPECGLMQFMRCVFFPLHERLMVQIDNGKAIGYSSYSEFEAGFKGGEFIAIHLKELITRLLCELVEPIREYLRTEQMRELVDAAYSET